MTGPKRRSITISEPLAQDIRRIRADYLIRFNQDISTNKVIILLLEEAVVRRSGGGADHAAYLRQR